MSKPPVRRLVFVQLVASIAIALVLAGWSGLVAGYSALLGGLTVSLANAWFLWRVFRGYGADNTKPSAAVLATYYRAEIGKLLLVAMLLTAILVLTNEQRGEPVFAVAPDALFTGLFVVLAVGVLSTSATLVRWLNESL